MKNEILKNSKAEVLEQLSKLNLNIPQVFHFTVKEWNSVKSDIVKKIILYYPDNEDLLAIRSSSKKEDGEINSMAGAFTSVLNVSKDRKAIEEAIERVISSFDEDEENQVLVQPMVQNVIFSGVAMSKSLDDGSPYYVINFDDSSGKTDTVTSGNSINKTVYVFNGVKESDFDSPNLLLVIKLIWDLEKIFENIPLDIEFAIDNTYTCYLLQVRRITTHQKWKNKANNAVNERMSNLFSYLDDLLQPRHNIYGEKSLLGLMPDWNPAEMIGVVPKPLAASLYKKLITSSTWRIARAKMGYRVLPSIELMVSLYGRTYIDVRNSFNSLLPDLKDDVLSNKLINIFIQRLEKNPHLHDKVEFEVIPTILDFNFDTFINLNYKDKLNEEEITIFRLALKEVTEKAINLTKENTLLKAIKDSKQLKIKQELFSLNDKNTFHLSDYINQLLSDCIEFGTIPFAIVARHGFIAESFLRSIIRENCLKVERVNEFKRNIKTISSQLSKDFISVLENNLSKKDFLNSYGHLRPSSYDILSLSYSQREDLFSMTNTPELNHQSKFCLTSKEETLINQKLTEIGLSINAKELFNYFELSIQAREEIKFIFTKHLHHILESIALWGENEGYTREDLSFLDINDILQLLYSPLNIVEKTFYNNKINEAKYNYDIAKSFKLSYLIRSTRDVFIVPQQRSAPNFIGDRRIEGITVLLSPYQDKIPDLKDKIVCIEGADPGYDWIFSRAILGLVTKYGGANSHMAIRCSEYGLPAAIGCGEQPFERILIAGKCLLDCEGKRLEPIFYN